MECQLCGGPVADPGYVGTSKCECCGAEYTYGEGVALTNQTIAAIRDVLPRATPVDDSMPAIDSRCLWFIDGEWSCGTLRQAKEKSLFVEPDISDYGVDWFEDGKITHWMPLPGNP